MNSKAQLQEGVKIIYIFAALFVFLAMFGGLMWLFGRFLSVPTSIDDRVFVDNYVERFISNPVCFAYQDSDTGVVYSGIIDASKFTDERLNSCYGANEDSKIEFMLELDYGTNNNKIMTDGYRLLAKQFSMYVLVYDGSSFRRGIMNVAVQGVSGA